MAQVSAENSISMPVATRRRFLAVAAVGSIVGAGSLAAVAMTPNDVPVAVTVPRHSGPDPVFGLIEAHKKADRDHEAALDEQEHLERIGDKAADWIGEATCHASFNAFEVLLAAPATTLPGIRYPRQAGLSSRHRKPRRVDAHRSPRRCNPFA